MAIRPPAQTLELLSPNELVSQFEQGVEDLHDATLGLSDEQLRARPIPGKWSTLEVVCHITDFELVNADRFQRVISQNRPTLFNADPDDFAASLSYQLRNLADELALIRSLRRHISLLLRNLSDSSWDRRWIHSADGELTLLQLLQRATKHIAHHIPFIDEKRRALGVPRAFQTQ